jgi:hypothetical protein
MKFGFICPQVPGHLNPMTALARHLQMRGHEVVFLYSSGARAGAHGPSPKDLCTYVSSRGRCTARPPAGSRAIICSLADPVHVERAPRRAGRQARMLSCFVTHDAHPLAEAARSWLRITGSRQSAPPQMGASLRFVRY